MSRVRLTHELSHELSHEMPPVFGGRRAETATLMKRTHRALARVDMDHACAIVSRRKKE